MSLKDKAEDDERRMLSVSDTDTSEEREDFDCDQAFYELMTREPDEEDGCPRRYRKRWAR